MFKEFVKALFFSKFIGTPRNYTFQNTNRGVFNNYLKGLKGKDYSDDLLLSHYRDMNTYCDTKKVELTDNELAFFKSKLLPGKSIPVSTLITEEDSMFRDNANNYPQNSLNYILRWERPGFITEYLPGTLNISE